MARTTARPETSFSPFLVLASLLILAISGVALGYMWLETRSVAMPTPAALAIEEISLRQEVEGNFIYVYVRNTGSTNATVVEVYVNNRTMVYAKGFALSGLYIVGNLSAGDRWTVTSVRSIWGSEVSLVSRTRYSEIKPGELLEIKISFGQEGWQSKVDYVVRAVALGGVWDEGRASVK